MTLSILLPTRNGAKFLPSAIDAVLSQDVNLELVVSDNANADGTRELLAERSGDQRLVVVRHEQPVPVTQNWTSALEASSGDYLLMIGDDDLLLPGGARRILDLIEDAKRPDCILLNAYSYVFPGSMAGVQVSQYADPHFRYGPEFHPYEDLPRPLRLELVRDMFRFRARLPLNMQTTIFSRTATERIRGAVFPPPFPDHYALNSMLLTADRWWHAPEKHVVIGVTPKSFGHFVYSSKQDAGLDYLGISAHFPGRVPGNALLDGMHIWLDMLREAYPDLLAGVEVSRSDYVARQAWSWLVGVRDGSVTRRQATALARDLPPRDIARVIQAVVRDLGSLPRAVKRLRPGAGSTEGRWQGLHALPEVADIGDFGQWVTNHASTERA